MDCLCHDKTRDLQIENRCQHVAFAKSISVSLTSKHWRSEQKSEVLHRFKMPVVDLDPSNGLKFSELDCEYVCQSTNEFNSLPDGIKIAISFATVILIILLAIALGICIAKTTICRDLRCDRDRRGSHERVLLQEARFANLRTAETILEIEDRTMTIAVPRAIIQTAELLGPGAWRSR